MSETTNIESMPSSPAPLPRMIAFCIANDFCGLTALIDTATANGTLSDLLKETRNDGDEHYFPMSVAAQHGSLQALKLVLKHLLLAGALEEPMVRQAIHMAASEGREACLLYLVTNAGVTSTLPTFNPHAPGPDRLPSLLLAARNGHAACVNIMLSIPGANINTCDGNKRTSLILAAMGNNVPLLKTLLSAYNHGGLPLDLNAKDKDGYTALMHCCEGNRIEAMQLLLRDAAAAVDVNAREHTGRTALMIAIEAGHIACVQALLKGLIPSSSSSSSLSSSSPSPSSLSSSSPPPRTVDLNAQDAFGDTGLHKAVKKSNLTVVEMLLAAPAPTGLAVRVTLDNAPSSSESDVNVPNVLGWTPLMLACSQGDALIAHTLVTQRGATGQPWAIGPLAAYASTHGRRQSRLVDVNLTTENGWTALMLAAEAAHVEAVEVLLETKCVESYTAAYHIISSHITPLHIISFYFISCQFI